MVKANEGLCEFFCGFTTKGTRANSRSYITDLDPDCLLALAATVPRVYAAPLRDFCHKHLAFRSLIGGEISVSFRKI